MLVRFIAAALISLSAVELALYRVTTRVHGESFGIFHGLLLALPLILGVVILVAAKPIARWLSEKLDE